MASPFSHTPSFVISDRYLWLAVGVFAVYAAYTTQSQLKTFKARCVSRPQNPISSNDAAVDRTTQDGSPSSSISTRDSRMIERILTMNPTAIKLETLEALARGINFDLRNAALKIITERATSCENIDFLRKQIEGRNTSVRLRALKAMRCLAVTSSRSRIPYRRIRGAYWQSGSFIQLCKKDVFRTLVICLKNTLPPNEDAAAQKEALFILARLMGSYYVAREMAIEAGIIEWLKALEIPGYENSVQAALDLERFDVCDTSLWEIVNNIIEDTVNGRRLMADAGLIEGEDDRGVEVSVEVDIVDVAAGRSAQSTWEGMLNMNSLPSEQHWTEG